MDPALSGLLSAIVTALITAVVTVMVQRRQEQGKEQERQDEADTAAQGRADQQITSIREELNANYDQRVADLKDYFGQLLRDRDTQIATYIRERDESRTELRQAQDIMGTFTDSMLKIAPALQLLAEMQRQNTEAMPTPNSHQEGR